MKAHLTVIGLAVLSIGIGSLDTWADEPEYVPDQVLVKYEEGVGAERIGEIEAEFGLTLIQILPLVEVYHYRTKNGEENPVVVEKLSLLPENFAPIYNAGDAITRLSQTRPSRPLRSSQTDDSGQIRAKKPVHYENTNNSRITVNRAGVAPGPTI